MKFPIGWIAQYVELPADEEAVARAFTLSGSEVEGRERVEGETVFDFNITVNRPDCMNVYGLAREASVLLGKPLRPPETDCAEAGPPVADLAGVAVEASDLCPRYRARVITGLRVGQSPAWMQKRLIQCGVRPINAVVDVTNYVLLEMGHPLHAFDMAKLAERRIVVRRARAGETILTLDGVQRKLDAERLVIADAVRPVALAGVMGGEETGVTEATADLLLEAAVFDPVSVRRTSRAFGMHTDASHRFERGVDPEGPVAALDRAARLIVELCGGGLAKGAVDVHPVPAGPRAVTLRHVRLEALLGMRVPPERCASILRSLGFGLEESAAKVWAVTVPSFRVDVSREADLIEEVVRIHGLEDLPSELPSGVDPVGGRPPEQALEERLRDLLWASGCSETIHMSMTDPVLEAAFGEGREPARLSNPLTPAFSVLRTSLLGPMAASLARNRARGARRASLFELGRVYPKGDDGAQRESSHLAILLYADAPPARWGTPRPPGLLELKGKVEAILERLGIRASFESSEGRPFAAGSCVAVQAGPVRLGRLGALDPKALEAAGLKSGAAYGAELDLGALSPLESQPRFASLSRFPSAVRDFSVMVDKRVPWGDLLGALKSLPLADLRSADLVDCYEGRGVPEGQRSVTFSLTFQAADRTLTEADVAPVADAVMGVLGPRFGATLR
ncbi:MAG: phenylalanine--tRNA ligase subunit beta [Acidobacteriota bacterium]